MGHPHERIDGKLLQMDKKFSNLKMKQRDKITAWVYEEYIKYYDDNHREPDNAGDTQIVEAVLRKISKAEIWIPNEEIYDYYARKKSHLAERRERERIRMIQQNGIENIFHRVSIRKYEDKPVEDKKIEQILKAAFAAPYAGNQQPWEFYVVTNKDKIIELAGSSPYAGCLKGAPVAIVPCYKKKCMMPEYAEIDLSIATEHIWLEADALGLGAVWLGIAPIEARMTTVEEILEIPKNLRAFGIVAIGYPAETKEQENRYHEDRVHFVK